MKVSILSLILFCFLNSYAQTKPHNTASLMFDSIGKMAAHVTVGKFDDGSWSFEVVDTSGCIVAYQNKGEPLNIVNSEEAIRIMETCLKWEYQRFNDKTNKSIQIKDSIVFWNCMCFVGCEPKLGGTLIQETNISGRGFYDSLNKKTKMKKLILLILPFCFVSSYGQFTFSDSIGKMGAAVTSGYAYGIPHDTLKCIMLFSDTSSTGMDLISYRFHSGLEVYNVNPQTYWLSGYYISNTYPPKYFDADKKPFNYFVWMSIQIK